MGLPRASENIQPERSLVEHSELLGWGAPECEQESPARRPNGRHGVTGFRAALADPPM